MFEKIEIEIKYEIKELKDLPKLKKIMEVGGMKPNFSRIARELECDRRTAKKYYNGQLPSETRDRKSMIDDYNETIKELLSEGSPQRFYYKSILWRYLTDNHGLKCAESTFRQYITKRPEFQDYFNKKSNRKGRGKQSIRFETLPGEQAQIDWKENIKYETVSGEIITVNVLVMVLGYSRFQLCVLTQNKLQSVLIAQLTKFFEIIGGVPRVILSDNLKTVMDDARTARSDGKINEKFYQFSRDMGFTVKPCMAYRPQTKGKVETQMKLLDEIHAYQGQLDYVGLDELVKKINRRKNMDVHQGTGRIPMSLFEEEKGFLLELPGKRIRTLYKIAQHHVKVTSLNMISYKGNQYSIPLGYQHKTLFLEVVDDQLYIYDNTKLITLHHIKEQKLNYLPEHYESHLKEVLPYTDNIAQYAQNNLKKIGGYFNGTKTTAK